MNEYRVARFMARDVHSFNYAVFYETWQ